MIAATSNPSAASVVPVQKSNTKPSATSNGTCSEGFAAVMHRSGAASSPANVHTTKVVGGKQSVAAPSHGTGEAQGASANVAAQDAAEPQQVQAATASLDASALQAGSAEKKIGETVAVPAVDIDVEQTGAEDAGATPDAEPASRKMLTSTGCTAKPIAKHALSAHTATDAAQQPPQVIDAVPVTATPAVVALPQPTVPVLVQRIATTEKASDGTKVMKTAGKSAGPAGNAAPLLNVSAQADAPSDAAVADAPPMKLSETESLGAVVSAVDQKSDALQSPRHSEATIQESGATFAYSLHAVTGHQDFTVTPTTKTEPVREAREISDAPIAQAGGTTQRLEVAVHDPVLGSVDVRAEMRGGALHASIAGARVSGESLHQFLQQHQVNVHSLSLNNNEFRAASSQGTSSSFAGSNSDAPGRDAQASQQQQRREAADWHAMFGMKADGAPTQFKTSTAPAAVMTQARAGSTLSIHI